MSAHLPYAVSTLQPPTGQLTDGFGRAIRYARLSITDRCDLRCTYCMADDMDFVPRSELLSIEELVTLARTLTGLGISKLRITGGEPLIRRGVIDLLQQLRQLPGLDELCLTTNGTHLETHARSLRDAGVDRINISLDSLNPDTFRRLTRVGDLQKVLRGIAAARAVGFRRIKLNCVALRHYNAAEIPALVSFALEQGLDISFIEEMPLGRIDGHGRATEFISSAELREQLGKTWRLVPSELDTGGPARYWRIPGHDSRVGFISPHSQNFCGSCNRIRITATGRLLLCLGQEESADLRKPLRESPGDTTPLRNRIISAIARKPLQHDFTLAAEPQILRFMNATGG